MIHNHPTAETNLEYAARIVAGDPGALVSTLTAAERTCWLTAAQEALDGDDSDLVYMLKDAERLERYRASGSRLEFWEWDEREDRVESAAYRRAEFAADHADNIRKYGRDA